MAHAPPRVLQPGRFSMAHEPPSRLSLALAPIIRLSVVLVSTRLLSMVLVPPAKKRLSCSGGQVCPFQRESRILLVILFCLVFFPRHVCPAQLPLPGLPRLTAPARFNASRRQPSPDRSSSSRAFLPHLSSHTWSAPLVFPAWSSRAWSAWRGYPCQDFPGLRVWRNLTHPAGPRARTAHRLPSLFFPTCPSRAWSARHVCPARLPLPGLSELTTLARFHLAVLRARTARHLPRLSSPLVLPQLGLPALAFPALGASLYVSLLFLGILYENICPLFGTPNASPMVFTNCLQTRATLAADTRPA